MPRASELKKGQIVTLNDSPYIVEDLQVQTPSARGSASLYKFRFRSLITRQKEDRSLKGEEFLAEANVDKREVQFSYREDTRYVFSDLSDYSEQVLDEGQISEAVPYLLENMEGITALLNDGRIVAIELPDVVELPIAECSPSVKGASATSRTKPATLSTGLVVQVPEYIAPGEVIRVDTRTGKFVSRA